MRTKQCTYLTRPPENLSLRELEERKLRKETMGIFAPAKPGSFFAKKRLELIEQYVQKGLDTFDRTQAMQDMDIDVVTRLA